ncbi:MAG: hypothetical protein HY722_10740, partial [Planctomycetes bacterium]|nr:hypothetical protein [Planctomycetota bacterium]
MKPLRVELLLPLAGMALSTWVLASAEQTSRPWTPPADVPGIRYVGADKCGLCHKAEAKGNQLGKWAAMDMARAYERLASPEARELGKTRGVAEPQKDPRCLQCHTTGHGLPAERFAPGFDAKKGVQCESCHGPGEKHVRARMAAAFEEEEEDAGPVEIPAGEIQRPTAPICLGCHNEESPGFKPFCFKWAASAILHMDPRRERSEEELAPFRCSAGEGCTCCRQAECSASGCEGAGCGKGG